MTKAKYLTRVANLNLPRAKRPILATKSAKYSKKQVIQNYGGQVFDDNGNFSKFWTKESHRLSENERQTLERRFGKDFYSLQKKLEQRSLKEVGFDINQDYFLPVPFNAKMLYRFVDPQQEYVMPLSQNIANKIKYAQKFKLFDVKHQSQPPYCNTSFYVCFVDNKPVLLTICTKTNSKDDTNKDHNNSVSVHLIAKGQQPLLLTRFDTNPPTAHPNKLDKDGKIPYAKNLVIGPHAHEYNHRLTVVYPFVRFANHCDATIQPRFKKFSDAIAHICKNYRFVDKIFENKDNTFVNLPQNRLPNQDKDDKIL